MWGLPPNICFIQDGSMCVRLPIWKRREGDVRSVFAVAGAAWCGTRRPDSGRRHSPDSFDGRCRLVLWQLVFAQCAQELAVRLPARGVGPIASTRLSSHRLCAAALWPWRVAVRVAFNVAFRDGQDFQPLAQVLLEVSADTRDTCRTSLRQHRQSWKSRSGAILSLIERSCGEMGCWSCMPQM